MTARTISPEEHERIAAAIRAAEETTSGEIYCVVARSSDSYLFAAASVVAISILIVGLGLALLLDRLWISVPLWHFAAAELLAFAAAVAVLYALPGIRIRLVPRAWQFGHAHDNAIRQFLSRNVHLTSERTGVLIFVSLAERYAEIVADAGINAKVGQDAWNVIVAELIAQASRDRLADGFVGAVQAVGALLAAHFPVRPGDQNELDDHLVEI